MFYLTQGSLSHEQRTGIVTLIPKKALDRLMLKNWRPITLLNADSKIFSKALANRLQICIKDVISTDQTGFICGGTIGTNLTKIQAVIDQAETSSPGFIFAVDYRKAFNTIRWDLIHPALQLFGFGDYIAAAVKLLFQDIRFFFFQLFSPQGIFTLCMEYSCLPSLFILAVELLAVMVRQSINISGLTVAGHQIRI